MRVGRAVLRTPEREGRLRVRVEGFSASVTAGPRSIGLWTRLVDVEVEGARLDYSPADGDPTIYVAERLAESLGLEIVEAVPAEVPAGAIP